MLRDRDYVYAVYRELSFSRAAQKLFISQPALSSKIKKVEERVGMPLFDRSTNPISLTDAGRCYIEAVEQVTAIEDELNARLGQLSLRKEGTVTVGSATYFCSYILPELALDFQSRHPGCTVALQEGNISALTQSLLSGAVDFVLDVDDLAMEMNDLYRRIIMVTGTAPDPYRDYFLTSEIRGLTDNCQLHTVDIFDKFFIGNGYGKARKTL